MARKKYAGSYLEKLYYDNTVFRGITATTDANSEGYFKQLINLDIADTGQSVQPRKGIINTSIYTNAGEFISLNADNTVYFKDNATGYYFFFDLGDLENIYKVIDIDSQLYEKQIHAELISGIITTKDNASDTTVYLEDYLGYQLENIQISLVGSGHAQYTKDENLIDRYVVRVQDISNKFWLALTYNATEDKMLFTVINTDNIVGLIDSDRNIASSAKLVPDVLTRIYETTAQAALDGITYNQFPFIYIQEYINENNKKYYIDRIPERSLSNIRILPRYSLLPPSSDHLYAFTYEFYNTSKYAEAKNSKKEFGIYSLEDNTIISKHLYTDLYEPLLNTELGDRNHSAWSTATNSELYSKLYTEYEKWTPFVSSEIILLIVPKINDIYCFSGGNDHTFPSNYTMSVCSTNYADGSIFLDQCITLLSSAHNYYSDVSRISSMLSTLIKNYKNAVKTSSSDLNEKFDYYVINLSNLKNYTDAGSYIYDSIQTLLNTSLFISTQQPLTASEAYDAIKDYDNIIVRYMYNGINVKVTNDCTNYLNADVEYNSNFEKLFPDYYTEHNNKYNDYDIVQDYYIFTSVLPDSNTSQIDVDDLLINYVPIIYKKNINNKTVILETPFNQSIMSNNNGSLSLNFNSFINTDLYTELKDDGYFDNGINFVLYISEIPILQNNYSALELKQYSRLQFVSSTNLVQSLNASYSEDTPTITLVDNINPSNIKSSDNWCIFNSNEGYRLVVWYNNIVYMSEANNYYYFKQVNKKEYPEKVIKAVPFKDKLIIFTTQNVYAIFPYEYTESVENGKNDDGTTKYVQKTTIVYNSLPVLYNLNTSEYYSKVIQVYNNMILFYSVEGQLYLITPSATVDSDTAYTLKFINQAANDILKNYTDYINKRLNIYGLDTVDKADIEINASVTITHIKIFYSVPKLNYTYVLLYDITNNRYTVYDTNIFGTLYNILHVGEESLYISKYLYNEKFSIIKHYSEPITELFETDGNNCDWFTNDTYIFDKVPIHTEIDTGIIYLNNQWKKRFRTLRTIYKNLDSYSITYDLDVIIDDVYINTNMSNSVELRNVNDTYKVETVSNAVNLLTDNTALFDFSCFNSNKIVTHTTNIPSVGKHIELIMRFKSKGKYKIQGFAIVYKEHSA